MKVCGKCKKLKDFSAFHKASRDKSGYQCWCKECRSGWKRDDKREKDRKRYREDPSIYREYYYSRTYGISLEEYNSLLSKQKGVCAICSTECISGRRLAVDHCHTTGKVRGLLCANCNRGLGLFKDSKFLLEKAQKYLEENNGSK